MAHIRREVVIEAPVEKVFGYASNLQRMPEWWPSLVENRTPKEIAEKGMRYEWTYKMIGFKFEGTGLIAELEPNRRFVIKTEGGIPATFQHEFSPEGPNRTRYRITVDYEVPTKLGGRFADKLFVERLNEREADHVVGNLKSICETP